MLGWVRLFRPVPDGLLKGESIKIQKVTAILLIVVEILVSVKGLNWNLS